MSTFRLGALWAVLSCLMLSCAATSDTEELVRGLVVDRDENTVWLGLPTPVEKNTVFSIYVVPGNKPIAVASVVEITPDAPYVAKAVVRLLREDAFIPVGAYVEKVGSTLPAVDRSEGFKAVDFHEETARRLTFRAGTFFPMGSDLGDETGNVWPTFQLAYRIGSMRGPGTQIGLAYYQGDGSFTSGALTGTRDLRVMPLTFDVSIPVSGSSTGGWMARIGAGAYSIRDERTLGATTTSDDLVTFGWQVGFGYVSTKGQSAEIYYTDVSKTDFQGVVFSLGARF